MSHTERQRLALALLKVRPGADASATEKALWCACVKAVGHAAYGDVGAPVWFLTTAGGEFR